VSLMFGSLESACRRWARVSLRQPLSSVKLKRANAHYVDIKYRCYILCKSAD
jgi:hypothetical protein